MVKLLGTALKYKQEMRCGGIVSGWVTQYQAVTSCCTCCRTLKTPLPATHLHEGGENILFLQGGTGSTILALGKYTTEHEFKPEHEHAFKHEKS